MSYADAVKALAPEAWWRLGDASWGTGTILDSSGNAHHGNGENTAPSLAQPGLLYGPDGDKAMSATGATGGVHLPSSVTWPESPSISIAYIIKSSVLPPSGNTYAIISRRGYNTGVPWAAYLHSAAVTPLSGQVGVPGNAYFLYNSGGTVRAMTATIASVCDGIPHHVVHTASNVSGSVTCRTFLDGAQVDEYTGPYPITTGDSDINIFAEWQGSAYGRNVIGTLDEVVFWKRGLSQAEAIGLGKAWKRGGVAY